MLERRSRPRFLAGSLNLAFSLCALILVSSTASSEAQAIPDSIPYELVPTESRFETGCLEPSPCDCLAMEVGFLQGQFLLELLLPPLGPVFDYQVVDVDLLLTTSIEVIEITGDGALTVDSSSGTVQMSLTVSIDGTAPVLFETSGAIPVNAGFPDVFDFGLFRQIDSCLFDGIRLFATARPSFIRGDANEDGSIDIADVIRSLSLVIPPGTGGPFVTTECPAAIDANGDGTLNIADPVFLVNWLFQNGPPPSHPFPDCGTVLPEPALGCEEFAGCP